MHEKQEEDLEAVFPPPTDTSALHSDARIWSFGRETITEDLSDDETYGGLVGVAESSPTLKGLKGLVRYSCPREATKSQRARSLPP